MATKQVYLVGNDTAHRRYLIASLCNAGIDLKGCLFEQESVKATFPTNHSFHEAEKDYLISKTKEEFPDFHFSGETWYVPTANHDSAKPIISSWKDAILVVSGAGLLRPEFLETTESCTLLNFHLGIAEEYRGLDTNLWAIYHKDWQNIGVTVHLVEPRLDTGPIVFQETLDIPTGTQPHELRYLEMQFAANLAISAIKQVLDGNLATRQQTKTGRYYSHLPSVLKDLVLKRFSSRYKSRK